MSASTVFFLLLVLTCPLMRRGGHGHGGGSTAHGSCHGGHEHVNEPEAEPVQRGFGARLWAGVVAGWAVVTGLAPHVLHHVGPLAGAALLSGLGGKAIFFAFGLLLSVPILRRLYGRFGTVTAPALTVVAFAAVFSFSSLVIAPRLTGSDDATRPPGVEQPAGHESHHQGGGK